MRLEDELKELIITNLQVPDIKPEDLGDDDYLFDQGLGLDSLDAVEIVALLKKHYSIDIRNRNEAREAFATTAILAAYIRKHQ